MNTRKNDLGFSGAWGRTAGMAISLRCKMFCRELKNAWQRAWRGYDDLDVCDLGCRLSERVFVLLEEFCKKNDTLFKDPDSGEDLTEAETNAVIAELISLFQSTDCPEEVAWAMLGKWCASLWY